jgi:hypothetical protein
MDKKVSKKIDGKWWTFGSIKVNKFNNLELGMKITPELLKLIADTGEGKWLNFSLFDSDGTKKPVMADVSPLGEEPPF